MIISARKLRSGCMPYDYLREPLYIPAGKLVRVYTTCVRPILEFSCEVWHYSLAQYLSDEIESIQRRALRIIFPDLKYEDALVTAGVVSLFLRRKTISEKLFVQMCDDETSHKLHSLVPPRHKTGYSLRNDNCLSIPKHRTSRFANSFIMAGKAYNSSFK